VQPAPAIPVEVADVTPEWLSQVLGLDVMATEVLDQHSGTTGRARLGLTYGGGIDGECPSSLFVKLPPFNEKQRRFVALAGLGTAEARFYRDVAADVPMRVPFVLHAALDDDGAYVMLLEDLEASGCRFPRPGDDDVVAVVDSIVDELARLHARFWEHPALDRELSWVNEGMRIAFGSGARFMQMALDQFAADMPPAYRRLGELYITETRRIADLWATPPHTLAHGDPHMGNLFVDGTWDVAYVICNSVPTDIRRANERDWIDRYRDALARDGIALTADAAWEQYRLYAVYSWNSAVSTAAMGSRWQPEARAHAAMLRTTTAIEDLDSIGLLEEKLSS
jgi:Phosphotransferase enzyme family